MAVLEKSPNRVAVTSERRRFQRVRVNLLGRFMLADRREANSGTRREFPCQVVEMSPGGMAVTAPVVGKAGERVIAYVDHIGRVEGRVVRQLSSGFVMTIAATPRKREKLASQLTWLANRHILNMPEDRRHGRIVPRNQATTLVLPDGLGYACRVIDLSLSGAAVAAEVKPTLGTLVTLGKAQGRVVRHLPDGFAVEFTRLQHPDHLEENVTSG